MLIGWQPSQIKLFVGMRLTITKNIDKANHVVNGMSATLLSVGRRGIIVAIPSNTEPVTIFPSHDLNGGWVQGGEAYYPIRYGWATTLHKIQGATLHHVTMWLDVPFVKASAYVALSRVQYDKAWRFVGKLDTRHFHPQLL